MGQRDERHHLGAQDARLERLDHVVHRTGRVGELDLRGVADQRGEEDDRDVPRRRTRADDARGFDAVESGHAHVEQDHGHLLVKQRA